MRPVHQAANHGKHTCCQLHVGAALEVGVLLLRDHPVITLALQRLLAHAPGLEIEDGGDEEAQRHDRDAPDEVKHQLYLVYRASHEYDKPIQYQRHRVVSASVDVLVGQISLIYLQLLLLFARAILDSRVSPGSKFDAGPVFGSSELAIGSFPLF